MTPTLPRWRTRTLRKPSLKHGSTKPVKLVISHRRSELKSETSVYNEWVCVILHEEPVRQRWWRSEEISEFASVSWDLISSCTGPIRQWGFSIKDTSLTVLKFIKEKPFWCAETCLGVVIWALPRSGWRSSRWAPEMKLDLCGRTNRIRRLRCGQKRGEVT